MHMRHMRLRHMLVAAVTIAVVLLGLGGFLWFFNTSGSALVTLGTETSDLQPAEIEQLAGITLPAEAQALQAHLSSFQDQIIYVRFVIPAHAVPALLASFNWTTAPLEATQLPGAFQHQNRGLENWWDVDQVTQFVAGNAEYTSASGTILYQDVLIETTPNEQVRVYVVAFNI